MPTIDTDIALGIQKILIIRCSKVGIYNPMLAQHWSMKSTGLLSAAMKYY